MTANDELLLRPYFGGEKLICQGGIGYLASDLHSVRIGERGAGKKEFFRQIRQGGEHMSATEELRRMLDERGVEYRFNELTKVFEWRFEGTDGDGSAHATEVQSGINIIACSLTPEQAIEATLGRGTCKEVKIDRYWRGCGECGYVWEFMYGVGKCERPHYCPNCGRKVVEQ